MTSRRNDLLATAALSLLAHGGALAGLAHLVGGAHEPTRTGEREPKTAVVVLGAERLQALLQPELAPHLPEARERSSEPHEPAPLHAVGRSLSRPPPAAGYSAPTAAAPRALPQAPAERFERLAPLAAGVAPPSEERTSERAESASGRESTESLPAADSSGLILSRPPLEYPAEARRRGLQGVVVVGLEVSEDGSVAACRLLASSGAAQLDRAALENVRRWRFDAGALAGREKRFRQEIRFSLR